MSQAVQKSNEQHIVAGDAAVLARRYALALFELAEEQKQLDAVAADLRILRSLQQDSAEFRYIAAQPRLTRAQLVKAMQQVSTTAGLNRLTGNFLSLVARNRRLSHIAPIIEAFLGELAVRRGEFMADVRTAQALNPVQQDQLAIKLREIAGGKVHLSVREDKSLIGGMTVKMGSRLIDASVKTRLSRLERQLKLQSFAVQKGAA